MPEEEAPAKEEAAPKAEAVPEAEPVQLIYLSRDSASTTEKVRTYFDRYEAETENVTVELQNLPSVNEALTKLKVAAAAGVPIDFLRCSWGSYLDLAEADVLQPLDDFFKRDGLVTTEVFLPATLTQWLDKGVLWGMPASGNCDALLINKQLLDVAGLERPPIDPSDASWTMDSFLEYAQAMTQGTEQFGHTGGVSAFNVSGIATGTYFGHFCWNEEEKRGNMDHPEFIDALQYWYDLREKHHVVPTAEESASLRGELHIWLTGKIGMHISNGYRPPAEFEVVGAALPYTGVAPNKSGRAWYPAILMGSGPKVDHAWNAMKWMISGENSVEYTLAMGHTISPVAAVSTLPAEQLKIDFGYDSVAHANQSAYSGPAGWGLLRYTTWGEWRNEIKPVYAEFNAGNMTAEEYGRAATDLLNAIIIQE
jgi:ABC-type glycerol-3-phosphate transport system substrate-binding protein